VPIPAKSLAALITPRRALLTTQVGPPLWAIMSFFFMAEVRNIGITNYE
jgi:hypothetical protein